MAWLVSPRERLRLLLTLVALHSAAVGLGLMLHPPALLGRMGLGTVNEGFFPAQGGAFHLVMAIGYLLAAWRPEQRVTLVEFALVVKVLATSFLLLYWLLVAHIWSVLASGLADGVMALLIAMALVSWRWQAREEAP